MDEVKYTRAGGRESRAREVNFYGARRTDRVQTPSLMDLNHEESIHEEKREREEGFSGQTFQYYLLCLYTYYNIHISDLVNRYFITVVLILCQLKRQYSKNPRTNITKFIQHLYFINQIKFYDMSFQIGIPWKYTFS